MTQSSNEHISTRDTDLFTDITSHMSLVLLEDFLLVTDEDHIVFISFK